MCFVPWAFHNMASAIHMVALFSKLIFRVKKIPVFLQHRATTSTKSIICLFCVCKVDLMTLKGAFKVCRLRKGIYAKEFKVRVFESMQIVRIVSFIINISLH